MNKLWFLTKIQCIDFFSRYGQQLNYKNKILGKVILFLPLLLFGSVAVMIYPVYQSFLTMGYPELSLTYLYVGTTMMIFFSSLPLIISIFFYSKDLSLLATLPVKENIIVFSKLTSIYTYLLSLSMLLFGSTVLFYAFGEGFNILGLATGLIGVLVAPILPMIFATLVILPFMSFIGGRKKRNIMVIFGNLILLTLIIGLQTVLTKIQLNPELIQELISSDDGLISLIGHKFPPSVWLTKMILGSPVDTIKFLGLNLIFIFILAVTAKQIYRKSMTRYNEQPSAVNSSGPLIYKKSSKQFLLIKRHLGIIYHNPTFLLNTVLTLFIPILIFVIYLITGIMSVETFKNPALSPYLLLIYSGVITAPVLMGSLSATVITREGKTFWETRVLPIRIEDNIKTRIYSSVLIYSISALVLGILSLRLMNMTLIDIIIAFFFCFSTILLFSTLDLIINIKRPYLDWTNPTAAVKNNLNILIAFIPRIVVFGLGYILYTIVPGLAPQIFIIMGALLFMIFYFLLKVRFFPVFIKAFVQMDV